MRFQFYPFLLLSLCAVLYTCNAQQGEPDIPLTTTLAATATSSLILEPVQSLPPGVIYADATGNPFHTKLLEGPIALAVFSKSNITKEPEEIDDAEETCVGPGEDLFQTWTDLQQETLFANGSTQRVGFAADLLPALYEEFNASVISEITRSRFFEQCDPKNTKSCEPVPKDKITPLTRFARFKRKVFSPDRRERVFNTRRFPWSTIGFIRNGGCTATLIGPRHVLTAGHCVHEGKGGGWHKELDFTLVRSGGNRPETTLKFTWPKVYAVEGWTKKSKREYDYALIVLDTKDTGEGWMSFGYDTSINRGWTMNLAGYPCDKPDRTLWTASGKIIRDRKRKFLHRIDAFDCQSGAPFWAYFESSDKRVIYGTHFGSFKRLRSEWNSATRINKSRFKQICGWMDSSLC